MLRFLAKDLKLQLRDYRELALLLLMPVILIAVLGFALGNFLTESAIELEIKAALVVLDDEATGREEFRELLLGADGMSPAERIGLLAASATIDPGQRLEDVLFSEELSDFVLVERLDGAVAAGRLEADEVQAVVTVPEGYTRDVLAGMLLGDRGGELQVTLSEASPLRASIVTDILEGFAREVSYQSALGRQVQGAPPPPAEVDGGVETFEAARGVSSVAYYTFGMAAMFALFVVGSISGRAFLEKDSLAFDRILVSGASPAAFLLSKTIAGAITVVLQLAFLFLAGGLMLGAFAAEPASFWVPVTITWLLFGLSVGALGGLVSAINFRQNNKSLSDVFSSVMVMVLAVLGGSFYPLEAGSFIARIGQWTPNGAALNSFLSAAQGAPLSAHLPDFLRLLGGGALLLLIAFGLFRRRGITA